MTRHYSATAVATTLGADITDSATSITVAATTGFPAVDFILALDYGEAAQELVLVTNVSGTTLTVTRGYDSTAAAAHTNGAAVRHVHSAIDFRDSRTHEAATSGVHGVAGPLVGTTDTQALSNKDLSSGTNIFPNTMATTNGAQTLTNKTVALGSNTVSGTTAQFNTALTDGDFATLAGVEALTNKDLSSSTNVFPASLTTDVELAAHEADTTTHGTTGNIVGTSDAQALTNKTIDLALNTLVLNGTVAASSFNFVIGGIRIAGGTITGPTGTASAWSGSVAFATAFSAAPLVQITGSSTPGGGVGAINWSYNTLTTTGFSWTAAWNDNGTHTTPGNSAWIAIGPA